MTALTSSLPDRPAVGPPPPPPPALQPSASSSSLRPGPPPPPPVPSASAHSTSGDPADAAAEEAKRAKKARLEEWRKKQAAKKALEEAKARAQSIAGIAAPTPPRASDGPTTINAKGLRGLSLRPNFNKSKLGSASAMDDTAEQPAKPQLKRFTLPPVDPLLKPGAGGKVGTGSDLEGGDSDDDDDDDQQQDPLAALVKPSNAMDVDGDDDDEEEDPLDAFMNTVKTEVKQVDDEDRKRLGKPGTSKPQVQVLGADESDGENGAEGEAERDELDQVGMAAEDLIAIAAKKVKKKDLPTVDHAKVDYEPFRKVFYHPPAEIEEMTEDQAELLRIELDAISVRGKDCPKPLTKWSHCGLPASCLDVIRRLGYTAPTSIQSQAIPAIMSGRDIIGVAKTGSGKTMAFLLPMFRHIKDQRPVESSEGPIGIVMTPTRELAVQIYRESKPFLKALGLRAACVYGGAPISEQIAEMKKTAEIVVATPGRLIDLLTANSGRVTNLRRVTYLVLDEADRMFDMGFEPQVMKIVNNIRPDRQTVLFSATFPKQMESLARKVLRNKPLEIVVGGRSVVAAEIEQIVEVRDEATKFNRLLEILGDVYNQDKDARTLIFVERQEAADDLLKDLIQKGYVTMSLHGGKDQVDRDETISDFKAGNVPIVTATSVAARGLDVKQLKLVINYDVPNHLEDYVHRAGRTGRAGNKGTCITFITPQQDRYAKDIISALKASKAAVPPELEALGESFKEKLAAGKAQAAGSGFGGKGLERLETDREKTLKAQRSAYGEGGDDEVKMADGTAGEAEARKEAARAAAADAAQQQRERKPKDPDATDYHAIVPINDFPQRARWRVTNKETMVHLIESTGASITNKGVFYKEGTEPQPGDPPKLQLLIESNNQEMVERAVLEIQRLLVEATQAAMEAEARNPGNAPGRYSVV
ncbi:uncharacterized protein PFL1_04039 [Pseudozyma flocculosa PF-1]|uniref:RNA helicase n=1 Tax=Pseudozyma flocculosa PF-1 TaxID=1277687 RepID=A0A061HC65_9BASI|nr:uncharacterized protein PFL1_04039 [Pseudozyma flocculosa PF-1]EPQ28211.1 hypothetical protein PFL1_04039 [Pseudozyma flocculosa PF-1]